MSDINISGIPNMGFAGGGGGYFASSGIGQTQPSVSATQMLGLDKLAGLNQASLNNTNPNATAYYAALGAAYGRGTGGFGGYGAANADPMTPVGGDAPQRVNVDSSVFDTGAQPVPYPNTSGVWGAQAGGGIGSNGFDSRDYMAAVMAQLQGAHSGQYPTSPAPQDFNALWAQRGVGAGGFGELPYPPSPAAPPAQPVTQDWNSYFNHVTSPARGSGSGWEGAYLAANPDVAEAGRASGMDPNAFADQHYKQYGQAEGRKFFDSVQYLQNNPDVAASGMDALQHYNNFGRGEGRNEPMGSVFDPATYLTNNRDVADAGVDPRTHWLQYGQKEGRQGGGIVADMPTAPAVPNSMALLGYDPNQSAAFAPNANANNFQNRFGMGFPNAGTPSQYTYQPYTNAQGQTFQPNMPQGFAPQYDVDHPQGALPADWMARGAGGA